MEPGFVFRPACQWTMRGVALPPSLSWDLNLRNGVLAALAQPVPSETLPAKAGSLMVSAAWPPASERKRMSVLGQPGSRGWALEFAA